MVLPVDVFIVTGYTQVNLEESTLELAFLTSRMIILLFNSRTEFPLGRTVKFENVFLNQWKLRVAIYEDTLQNQQYGKTNFHKIHKLNNGCFAIPKLQFRIYAQRSNFNRSQ